MRTQAQHFELHRLWTLSVGKEGYNKEWWKALEQALHRCDEKACEQLIAIAQLIVREGVRGGPSEVRPR